MALSIYQNSPLTILLTVHAYIDNADKYNRHCLRRLSLCIIRNNMLHIPVRCLCFLLLFAQRVRLWQENQALDTLQFFQLSNLHFYKYHQVVLDVRQQWINTLEWCQVFAVVLFYFCLSCLRGCQPSDKLSMLMSLGACLDPNVPQVAVRFWNYEKLNCLTLKNTL